MVYVLIFFFFAFLGWLVDSSYSSITAKKLVISGYFRGLPFCPIYGFGGILIVNSFSFLAQQPAWLVILFTTFLVIILEYMGGFLVERFLDERLWDYSNQKFNLVYISAWHSFLWLIAVTVIYLFFGAKINFYLADLKNHVQLNDSLEVLLVSVLLIGIFFLTSHHKKLRLIKLAKKQFNRLESLDEFFDLDKWQKLASDQQEELLANWDDLALVKKLKAWCQNKLS